MHLERTLSVIDQLFSSAFKHLITFRQHRCCSKKKLQPTLTCDSEVENDPNQKICSQWNNKHHLSQTNRFSPTLSSELKKKRRRKNFFFHRWKRFQAGRLFCFYFQVVKTKQISFLRWQDARSESDEYRQVKVKPVWSSFQLQIGRSL